MPPAEANQIAQLCKTVLERHYGDQFQGLILYGSLARGGATWDTTSDIDLLVLLSKLFDFFQELERIVDLLFPLQLKTDRLISAKPAAVDEFREGWIQPYRNAKREGLAL